MSTAKVIEIVASSPTSFDEALKQGLEDASRSLRGISGVKVTDWTVDVEDNKPKMYKLTMHIAFELEK